MFLIRIVLLTLLALSSCRQQEPAPSASQTYYGDCAGGNDQASGTDPSHAWRSLTRAGSQMLQPGSKVLIRRGATCSGTVALQGSGTPSAPIRISAYGEGPLPVIDAAGSPFALRLNNQDGWEVSLLELRGGTASGLSVSCDDDQVHSHFRFHNLIIHGVRGMALTKRRGLLAIAPSSDSCTFSAIDIDGVTAFDSTQWAGIVVDGGYPPNRLEELESLFKRLRYYLYRPESKYARGVTIRNSIVHDVAGDGIVVFRAENAAIESNLSWNVGMQERGNNPGQSPNAMWTLLCRKCAIRDNEAYLTDTPIVDGGAFDIDWGSEENVIEYNYGHDNTGYCFSVFGSRGIVTTGSIVRYNICVNNGRGPRMAKRQGDIFISTWDKGILDGLQVYRNTLIWNPSGDAPMFRISDAHEAAPVAFEGSHPRHISNNLAISTASTFGSIDPAIENKDNRFWHPGLPDRPALDPLLRPVSSEPQSPAPGTLLDGAFDAFRTPILATHPPFAGALLPATETLHPAPAGPKVLRIFLDPASGSARRTVLLARSAAHQFGPLGLQLDIRLPQAAPRNLPHDWHFSDLPHAFTADQSPGPAMQILDGRGSVLMAWPQRPTPAGLNLALRWFVGAPRFSPSIAFAFEGSSPAPVASTTR